MFNSSWPELLHLLENGHSVQVLKINIPVNWVKRKKFADCTISLEIFLAALGKFELSVAWEIKFPKWTSAKLGLYLLILDFGISL